VKGTPTMDIKLVEKRLDSEAEAAAEFVVSANLNVPEQRIKELICCGMEGGISYWAEIIDYEFAGGLSMADFKQDGKMQEQGNNYFHPSEIIPFSKGCSVVLRQTELEGEEADVWRLNRAAIVDGLRVMMNKYPKHASNFLDENEDAETGDVFIQCCLLGEVIYG